MKYLLLLCHKKADVHTVVPFFLSLAKKCQTLLIYVNNVFKDPCLKVLKEKMYVEGLPLVLFTCSEFLVTVLRFVNLLTL